MREGLTSLRRRGDRSGRGQPVDAAKVQTILQRDR